MKKFLYFRKQFLYIMAARSKLVFVRDGFFIALAGGGQVENSEVTKITEIT